MNMIKRLHRRLTALYTVTTGLILTAVLLGVLAVGTGEFRKKNLETFQNTLLSVTSRLQSGGTIDCTWLARMEERTALRSRRASRKDFTGAMAPILPAKMKKHTKVSSRQ